MNDQLFEHPAAGWLEDTLPEFLEFDPISAVLVAVDKDGEVFLAYHKCGSNEFLRLAGELQAAGVHLRLKQLGPFLDEAFDRAECDDESEEASNAN